MAVQSSFYNTDGSTRTFPSTKHIATQQHCSVYVKSVATSVWSIVNIADFELINNSIVFDIAPDIALYSQIEVRVADTADELVNSPSDIAIVAGSIANVNTVATNIVPVTTVATNIATVQTVSANIANVNTVAGSIANVNTVATSIADVNSVATTIVPNIAEILLADTNAATATTQAGIATTQATNSQLSAWIAEAEKMTADSYATEAEDVVVKVYTSDGDGTFTATPTAEYSALHWAAKSATSAGTFTIDATPTDASTNAVSSNGVFDALALKAPTNNATFTGTLEVDNGGFLQFNNASTFATILNAITPTADRNIQFPDASGTIATTAYVLANTTGSSIVGLASTLVLSANGVSANTIITANEITVESAANTYQTLRAVSLTVAVTTSGANGLDTGTIAASTWYSVWVIWNGTTTAGLLSLSSTAPTLPSGYTHKARVGWIRTDATANKFPLSFIQYGKKVQYKLASASNLLTLPTMASGAAGSPTTPTYVSVATGNFVPSTASRIQGVLGNSGTTNTGMVAPNNLFGGTTSATNPPPAVMVQTAGSIEWEFALESTNIYWAMGASGILNCLGWEDNL